MRFCELCGTGHDCERETGAEKTEVAIERLRTNRDIEVARISASTVKDVAEVESEHSAEHAEGVAEGMETALDAVTGGGGEPDGEPPVLEVPAPEGDPVPEPEDNAPPEVIDTPEPDEPDRAGWWSNYR
jgi:hypothetical protein